MGIDQIKDVFQQETAVTNVDLHSGGYVVLLLSKNLMALLLPYFKFWIEIIKGQVCRTL